MTSLNDHVRNLGIATIIYHGLVLTVLFVIIPLTIGGGILASGEESGAGWLIGGIGALISIVIVIIALPGIVGGIGLIRGKRWGKIVTIVANALTILSIPFGTALAVYTWWVLLNQDADAVLT